VGGTERSEIVRGPEDEMTLSMRVLWSPRWGEGLAEEKIGGFDVGEARGQSGARLQIWPDDVQAFSPLCGAVERVNVGRAGLARA
jgi:hypothetical protein